MCIVMGRCPIKFTQDPSTSLGNCVSWWQHRQAWLLRLPTVDIEHQNKPKRSYIERPDVALIKKQFYKILSLDQLTNLHFSYGWMSGGEKTT